MKIRYIVSPSDDPDWDAQWELVHETDWPFPCLPCEGDTVQLGTLAETEETVTTVRFVPCEGLVELYFSMAEFLTITTLANKGGWRIQGDTASYTKYVTTKYSQRGRE